MASNEADVASDRLPDEKSLYSGSGPGSPTSLSQSGEPLNPRGIDAEVAKFFAEQGHTEAVNTDLHATAREITPEENSRLRWLIHKRVAFIMVITYLFQTLDKGTLSFASIMGIVQDTHLHGQQYSWLTTCTYIAVIIAEFPMNRLIQRLPIAKLLAFCVCNWGLVLACTAACKNFAGLVAVRSLLGMWETVSQPAFVYLSTMWYRRSEQGLIIAAFYAGNGMQQCIGGVLSYGIAQATGGVIKNWQIFFLLLGCITIVWGFFVAFWLPDSPMRAKCFTPEDRVLMVERVRSNETGIQNRTWKWPQCWEAVKDPVVWLVTLISFTNALPTGGLGAYSGILIKSFGYTTLQTYLLAIAQGCVIMTFLFSAAFLSKRFKQRLICEAIYTLPNIAGTIAFLTVPIRPDTKVGLLLAFYCTMAFGGVAVLNLAVESGNIAGRTKQAMTNGMVFVAWATGNAIGPQVFRAGDTPRYHKAFTAHMVMYVLQISAITLLRIVLMRRNVLKRRAQGQEANNESAEVSGEKVAHRYAFDDLTDRENPDFRYVY